MQDYLIHNADSVLQDLKGKGLVVSLSDILIIAESLNVFNTISAMNESYFVEAKKTLAKIAYTYCSIPTESIVSISFDEIANSLRRTNSDMTLAEISLAFEAAAMGKTDANTISYGAGFTLTMVGDVLNAYKKWKNKVKWSIIDLSEKANKPKMIEKPKHSHVSWWASLVSDAKNGSELPNWELLPINYLVILSDSGMIEYKGNEKDKEQCYRDGIEAYLDGLKKLRDGKGGVCSYTKRQEIERNLNAAKVWRQAGMSLKKNEIPVFLRENGWSNGLKIYAVKYLEKMKKGQII